MLKNRLTKVARAEMTVIMDRLLDRARQEQEWGVPPISARLNCKGGWRQPSIRRYAAPDFRMTSCSCPSTVSTANLLRPRLP